MHESAETVFDRYGWDLDAAEVVSEEGSETVYQTAETIAVGGVRGFAGTDLYRWGMHRCFLPGRFPGGYQPRGPSMIS